MSHFTFLSFSHPIHANHTCAPHSVFLISLHIHVRAKGYDIYMWGMWAVWAFDRLFRAGRYVLFNLILRPRPSPDADSSSSSTLNARITAIGADGMRVALRRRVLGGWQAGQHAFLAFPTLGLQSHPFTIASIYDAHRGGAGSTGETGTKEKVEKRSGKEEEAEMVFLIRAMDGQTRTLLHRALASESGSFELPAMVDGPYGHPEDIRPFETCVFIAGERWISTVDTDVDWH